MNSPRRKVDLARIWFIASCAVLVFAYGVAVGRYRIFPFGILDALTDAVVQLATEAPVIAGRRPSGHLTPARHDGDGVTVLRPELMAPGLTLVAGLFDGEVQLRLIEPDGTPVRKWSARFTELFERTDFIEPRKPPQTDWNAQLHGALALPDGSVLFNFEYAGSVKMDRCGEVEWLLRRRTHHSVGRSQDGGYWIPSRNHENVVAGLPWSGNGYGEDRVLRVSDAGEVVEEVPIARILVDNGLMHLMLVKDAGEMTLPYEIVHLNDIEELPDALAPAFPDFEGGDLMLSFRNLNVVMVVDRDDWTVKWWQMGPWIRQHDPDFQSDGTITIFDNNDDGTLEGLHFGGSKVVALEPATGEVRRLYGGVPEQEMHTHFMGKHDVLPNGNLLITQAQAGRVLEVTGSGDVAWEFVNRYDEDDVAVLTSATRYPPSYFEVEDWSCPQ